MPSGARDASPGGSAPALARDVGVGEHAHGEAGRRERVTASGQLRLPSCWPALPVKSSVELVAGDRRGAGAARGRRRAPRARRSPSRVAVRQRGQARARAPLGVVEHGGGRLAQRRGARCARRARRGAATPMRLAASCARRSARRSAGWRICAASSSIAASSSTRGAITTPSSSSVRRVGGHRARDAAADVGVVRARARRSRAARRRAKTGVIDRDVGQVRAAAVGVVEHPRDARSRGPRRATAATAAGIAPRCTGMCSACMTISPPASNSAVEQSRRSLMFAECARGRAPRPSPRTRRAARR